MHLVNWRTVILLGMLVSGVAASSANSTVGWVILLVLLPVTYTFVHSQRSWISKLGIKPASPVPTQATDPSSLIDNLPIGVYQSDMDGNLLFSNPAIAKMLRYESVAELLQHNVKDHLAHPEQHEMMVTDYLQHPGYVTNEYQLKRKDGAQIWVRDIAHGVLDEANTFAYFEGVLQDIDLYKSVESALDTTNQLIRRAKKEWEASIDSLSELVCLLDDKKCIIRANRTLENWGLGNVKDVVGTSLVEILESVFEFPDFAERLENGWQQLERGHKGRFEVEDVASKRIFLVQLNPIALEAFRTETYDTSSGVVVISDVSVQKHLERDLKELNAQLEQRVQERTAELETANEQLQIEFVERTQMAEELSVALAQEKQLNAFKTRFGTLISHEFRTPLTVIQTAIDLLERYGDKMPDEKRREIPSRIRKQIRHLVNMIDDIMTISKAETIGLETQTVPLRFGAFVQDICDEFVEVFTETHQFIFSDQSNGAMILADPAQMRQVIVNVLGNAFKYSEHGSTVVVTVACGDKKVLLTVRDTGIGIPEEARPHLFNIFFRAENVGMISGTGLGLAIVKLVVDQHQGTITYESELDSGTTFTIGLPIRQHKL